MGVYLTLLIGSINLISFHLKNIASLLLKHSEILVIKLNADIVEIWPGAIFSEGKHPIIVGR